MKTKFLVIILAAFFLSPLPCGAWYPRLTDESFLDEKGPAPVIGKNRPYFIGPQETLVKLARRGGFGYQTLTRANPEVDPWLPREGAKVILPYASILPQNAGLGITINLAELRLYYVWAEKNRRRIRIYPVAIGAEGSETPEGEFTITTRVEKPMWTVPPSIRQKRQGLPASIPPGPDNPVGDHWLGLSAEGYGIHGTNKPFGLGRKVSSGCIRLYPEDIRDLFGRVTVGTPVRILYQPVKVGLKKNVLFIEVHPDEFGRISDPLGEVLRQKEVLGWRGELDWKALWQEIKKARGIPVQVSIN
jgi:L,D-transpeptidase ErfK/SrfK